MAMMKFREPNQVLWQGVRPGHNGGQVLKEASADNALSIIHTVTAGKTLHLCSAEVGYTALANGVVDLYIRDVLDVLVVFLFRATIVAANGQQPGILSYWPPLEVAAGYDMVIATSAAGLTSYAMIHGWEE